MAFILLILSIFASTQSQHLFQQQQQMNQKEKTQYEEQLKLIQQQESVIRMEVEAESPLISELRPISLMLDQFINNQGFYNKVQNLHTQFSTYRKTRRDGSCFYRALTFSLFEAIYIKKDTQLKQKLLTKLKGAKDFLIKANFQGLIFEDMLNLLTQKFDDSSLKKIDDIISLFCDPGVSNYLILMMRFLTSGQIKNNAILYETFIENELPIEFFCQTEVEQIDKEADQIQIMALLNYLEVAIKIIYLDSNVKSKEAYTVLLPENSTEKDIKATLLYRPGHYDILY